VDNVFLSNLRSEYNCSNLLGAFQVILAMFLRIFHRNFNELYASCHDSYISAYTRISKPRVYKIAERKKKEGASSFHA
jgi:hypothetical protein